MLTKPSKPSHNDGFDNEDYDYILYVNDWLGTDSNKYVLVLIIFILGFRRPRFYDNTNRLHVGI